MRAVNSTFVRWKKISPSLKLGSTHKLSFCQINHVILQHSPPRRATVVDVCGNKFNLLRRRSAKCAQTLLAVLFSVCFFGALLAQIYEDGGWWLLEQTPPYSSTLPPKKKRRHCVHKIEHTFNGQKCVCLHPFWYSTDSAIDFLLKIRQTLPRRLWAHTARATEDGDICWSNLAVAAVARRWCMCVPATHRHLMTF